MQSVSSRIWTRIAVFISYGDNDYTTGTSYGIVVSEFDLQSRYYVYSHQTGLDARSNDPKVGL